MDMKLVIAVVHDEDVEELTEQLGKSGFGATKLATTGTFLKQGNTTLMIGSERGKEDSVLDIIREVCRSRKQECTTPLMPSGATGVYIPCPMEVTVGGATIFVLDTDRFEKI